MIVHKIKMYSILLIHRVRPIIFKPATQFVCLKRRIKRIFAKQFVFLACKFLNAPRKMIKLFFKLWSCELRNYPAVSFLRKQESRFSLKRRWGWIPAFAGMTEKGNFVIHSVET